MKRLTISLLFISLLVACSPSGEPTGSEPQAAVSEVTVAATAVATADTPRATETELSAPVIEEPVTEEVVETAVAEPEAVATPLQAEETAVTEAESPAPETAPMVVSGRLDEGAFFLGDPNAPVTLIDYSDFL